MQEFLQLLDLILKTFEFSGSPEGFLILFGLLFARFFAFIYVVPFFGGQAVPTQVKVAVATALVIITYPSIISEIPMDGSPLGFGSVGFLALVAKEIFVGFTLGFVASVVFQAVLVAGRIIDFQRGLTMGELLDPQRHLQISQIGQFKIHLAIVVFLLIGAHRFFISALIRSYEFIPATKFPNIEAGWTPAAEFLTILSASVFSIGIQLAIPVILTLLLTDLFFGLINRIAPQINTFFLSLPIKMFMGIFVLALSIQIIVLQYIRNFDDSYEAFEFMIQLFNKMF